ncbi:MAG: alpha/beta hydrolase [Cyanothece sp. SIO2G6]|nr:alpha/beta hydrolase [Cyanothece sp. SIO2G6]
MPNGLRFLSLTPPNPALPLFIFLPGMDGTALSMQQQLAGLKPGYDLCYLSVPSDDLTSWRGYIDQVVAHVKFERHRHDSRPIYLCGESFGGCLALQVVAAVPALFAGLIVVNAASAFKHLFWQTWIAVVVRQMSVPVYQLAANIVLPLLLDPERVAVKNRDDLLNAIQIVTPESAAWRLSLLANARIEWRSLPSFTAPTLLIASGRDQLLPSVAEAQRLVPYFAQAQVVTLTDSSHACLLEKEVNLAAILRQAEGFYNI